MKSTDASDIIDNIGYDCLSQEERVYLTIYAMGVLTGIETKETRFWYGLEQILI